MRVWATLLCTVLCGTVSGRAADPSLAVIVHPQRSDRLSRDDVADLYLAKRRFWSDGHPVVPVNREPDSAVRETFSRRVLGGSSQSFADYWNEQYFDGVFPPTTLHSSEAVKRYVAIERNAIGYIELDAVDESVRVVLRLP